MISMGQAFKLFWKRYVDFTGKSTRAEYWWMALWLVIIYVVATLLALISGLTLFASVVGNVFSNEPVEAVKQLFAGGTGILFGIIVLAIVLFTLAIIIPSIALLVRRLRDAGLTTWAVWVLVILTWILSGSDTLRTNASFTLIGLISGLLSIARLVFTILPTGTLSNIAVIGNGDYSAVEVTEVNATPHDDSNDEI